MDIMVLAAIVEDTRHEDVVRKEQDGDGDG